MLLANSYCGSHSKVCRTADSGGRWTESGADLFFHCMYILIVNKINCTAKVQH